jgi:prolyl 4-hydroxylase
MGLMEFSYITTIDLDFCDKVIEWFNKEEENNNTRVGLLGMNEVIKEIKDSIDINLQENYDLFEEYAAGHLNKCVNEYLELYPQAANYSAFGIESGVNVQKYYPTGGFKTWHCERFSAAPHIARRHLVFMTYLNDVSDKGETEWYHQKFKLKPEKGKTIIWPADWTFTHRGVPSPTETKYIITGWLEYLH